MSDLGRLRILNLLSEGSLCVCHLLEVLNCEAVKMSKQLAYMKRLSLLTVEREANWKVYSINQDYRKLVRKEMKTLRKLSDKDFPLRQDLEERENIIIRLKNGKGTCPEQVLRCC